MESRKKNSDLALEMDCTRIRRMERRKPKSSKSISIYSVDSGYTERNKKIWSIWNMYKLN